MTEQTRITRIDRTEAGYRVYISNRNRPLRVSERLHQRDRLKAGIVISPGQLEKLERDAELDECDRQVANMLARRERSVHEVTLRLKRKEFDPEAIKQTLRRYVENGLLDDAHFASSYVRSIMNSNPAGRSFLIAMLRRKGIDRQISEQAVELLLADQDDTELAVRTLRKRWSLFKQLELERARRKAYTYLSRRGIGYEAARAAFERLCNEGIDNQNR